MARWKIAGVQMDISLGQPATNLANVLAHLATASAAGAKLVVFPECVLPGYCFESKAEAMPFAETLPGPSTEKIADACARHGVWCAVGMLECRTEDDALFNSCALIGPAGQLFTYRKIHLPFLGVDRFTRPGDRPFEVHDLGGLRVGMNICYDGSFPEGCRELMLLGADLVILPTNWPPGAMLTARHVIPTRALENHIYFAAVDRVGTERGVSFIGCSQIVNPYGEALAQQMDREAAILYADIDPALARNKKIIKIPGAYELDRLADRRPEMYPTIATKPVAERRPG